MMDEFDVTIVEANLFSSRVSGQPAVRLTFSPLGRLCFVDDRRVGKLYCSISNDNPRIGWRRARLRSVLGMDWSDEPFTDEELGSMVGRLLRVSVETMEFRGVLRLRVVDFLLYSGVGKDLAYSDNEYVFMMRERIQAEGARLR